MRSPFIQPKLTVNTPGDQYEQEADVVASAVMSTPAPLPQPDLNRTSGLQRMAKDSSVQRMPSTEESVQRKGTSTPKVSSSTTTTIRSPGAGSPLPGPVRNRIEPKVGANLSGVRVHSGPSAQRAASSIGARAFTHSNNIFLNRSESSHNLGLMAHEATHVVQQGAAPVQRQPLEASEAAIQRKSITSSAPPDIQRFIPDAVLEELADYARHIPGYTLFTVLIEYDPLRGKDVPRTPMTLLEGLMGLVPFGTYIFDTLREKGIIQAAFDWVTNELRRLNLSLGRIEQTIDNAWEDVRLTTEGFDYNLAVVIRHFNLLYQDVVAFAESLVDKIIDLIKEAVVETAESLLAENKAWSLLKKVIHYNPLRDEAVEASTVEILEDFLLLIGREQELEQMKARGTLQETADWIDTQIETFQFLLETFKGLISDAWNAVQPENLLQLDTNLASLAIRAGSFLEQVWTFASTVASTVLEFIKKALLSWLSTFATDIPGYRLLTVMLRKDPFTNEAVPRTPINLIRGFMSLLPGGERQFQQMNETGVIPQAAQRIEAAMETLGITWPFVQQLFIDLWNAFTIEDLLEPVEAFTRILEQFGEPIGRLVAFVIEVIKVVMGLILEMMHFPSDLVASIIANALQALDDIKRDPIGFLINLLNALKRGFDKFFGNILTHLLDGLTGWLFGQLAKAGIQPPTELSLETVLDLVFQLLGITIDNLWQKLADRIGQEKVDKLRSGMERLEGIWIFIQDVQERGVAAIWEKIESQISNLWNMVLEKVQNFVMVRVIEQMTARLLSMLDPTGIMAVINSFVAFFDAVQSAVEYFREILEIVNSFTTTVAEIARGSVEGAAQFLENTLAMSLPVAIGFLANQVGLGDLGDRIGEIIADIRGFIDRAINWLIDQAIRLGGALLEMGRSAVGSVLEWWRKRTSVGEGTERHTLYFEGDEDNAELTIASTPTRLLQFITQIKNNASYQDPAKQAAIILIETEIATLRTLRRERRSAKSANQTTVVAQKDTAINAAYDVIVAQLGIVLSDSNNDTYGTRQDPIPLTWPGPNSINYPTLYFGGNLPTANRPKLQATMQAQYVSGTLDETGTAIQEFKPHERKSLPGGGTIGLTSEFYISSGKIVGPLTSETTEGGDNLGRLIIPYGFSGALDVMDLDHVHEVQFGGLAQNDKVENLWPLDASLNRSKGSRLSRAAVEYPKGTNTTIDTIKRIQNSDVQNRRKFHFKV